jgi:TonB family protein
MRIFRDAAVAALAVLISAAWGTGARSEIAPITPDMIGVSAIACAKINDAGRISGAFLLTSTGNPTTDRHVLDWVRQLKWDPAGAEDKSRSQWFPMPVLFGEGKPLTGPTTCAPTEESRPVS